MAQITVSIIDNDSLANGYDCPHLSNELELWSVAEVLDFAIHLVFGTQITPRHFANVTQHTSLQRTKVFDSFEQVYSIPSQSLGLPVALIITINRYLGLDGKIRLMWWQI